MKATDLMIGDWVCYDGDENHECPVRIDAINTEEAGVEGDYNDIWEPIPLTAEMLDKNGFERRKETRVDCYDLRQDKASVYLEIKDRIEHEWLCVIGRHYPTSWRCRLELRVHEVHELQHALRLCGIDKEIVL